MSHALAPGLLLLSTFVAAAQVLACTLTGPTVLLPQDAPAALRELCGWATEETPLLFAGPATLAELGLADSRGRIGSPELVYAVVSRDPIAQASQGGRNVIVARAICWTGEKDILAGQSAVPDSWQPPVRH
jgi:hypothetical protein